MTALVSDRAPSDELAKFSRPHNLRTHYRTTCFATILCAVPYLHAVSTSAQVPVGTRSGPSASGPAYLSPTRPLRQWFCWTRTSARLSVARDTHLPVFDCTTPYTTTATALT